jgi:hypothetical protein
VSTGETSSTPAPTGTPTHATPAVTGPVPTTPPTAPTTTSSTTPATAGAPAAGSALTVAAAAGTPIATVQLSRSAATVYPVKDGYRDSVRFDVRGFTADQQPVGVTGTAELKKSGSTVKSWSLNGANTSLTWNGRVGSAVKTGVYTLLVTARSNDGTTHTASTTVQVLSQHLVTRTATAKSKVTAKATTATMPKAVKKALALGRVSLRLRTVATVHGKASLVFASGSAKRSIALRSGTRTTAALAVPKSFSKVTVEHVWKKGTRLRSATAIWSYKALVR